MLAVLKKELKTYFLTPLGYIFIAVFMISFSFVFYSMMFNTTSDNLTIAKFEYVIANSLVVLTFITPVLTMRMFAEERRNGTEQLLLTSPRGIPSIVLGKFIAAAIIMIITELFTFMYFIILDYFGNPSLLVALSTLFGFLLLSLAYISFGMFASSITENQIIAAVITVGAFLAMLFLPDMVSIFNVFSLVNKFQNFPEGMISISEIITFISFTVLFILLTIIILQRRKSVK